VFWVLGSGFCRSYGVKFHHPDLCDYILEPDHQLAVDAATNFISVNQGGWFPGSIHAGQVSPLLVPGSPTAELALSFLTDPIEIRGTSIFDNGPHRATALFDVDVTGLIPVKR
jgi:hypothetical protein